MSDACPRDLLEILTPVFLTNTMLSSAIIVALAFLAVGESNDCSDCGCVSCSSLSAAQHHHHKHGTKGNTEVDFLQLVVQSEAGFCQVHKCAVEPDAGWTLHGLWPSQKRTMGPCSCNVSAGFDVDSIQNMMGRLKKDWPSLTGKDPVPFWRHEWCKHGTCAVAAQVSGVNDQHSYFSQTLSLFQRHDIAGSLAGAGIKPSDNTTYSIDQISSAFSLVPKLDCKKAGGRQLLVQLRMCYTTDLQQVDCQQSWFDDDEPCSQDQDLYYV